MNVRLQLGLCIGLCSCLLSALLPPRAQAQAPCIQVSLPEGLAQAQQWRAQIALETGLLEPAVPGSDVCATLLILDGGERDLSIEARYQGRSERSALQLDDVPEVHHARVAALVAESLLRAVLDAPTSPQRRQPAVDAPQAYPEPALRRAPRPYRALHLQLGSRAFLERVPPLGRMELLARWRVGRPRLRYNAGVVADLTTGTSEQGRLIAGSVGLRAGIALPLLRRRRARLWLGPNVEASALITSANPNGPGATMRDVRFGAASADLRLSAELGAHDAARGVLSLDIGGVVHAVRLRSNDDTIVAYAGGYLGFALGVAIGL